MNTFPNHDDFDAEDDMLDDGFSFNLNAYEDRDLNGEDDFDDFEEDAYGDFDDDVG